MCQRDTCLDRTDRCRWCKQPAYIWGLCRECYKEHMQDMKADANEDRACREMEAQETEEEVEE
jgi:hypothetical protein